ncbi:hypothetical protein [Romboutsia sp. MSSM.1001216sp_RTP31141st1_G3_RTP31141_220114]|uniref:hypothetical protein n=1 Tax=unclassified Romboutsia TaxID=2626894 RepID=UPI0031B5E0CC
MKKIKYKLGLYFSDRMFDNRDISFSILLPIEFDTEEEAIAGSGCFFAKMEYLDEEVVINIYEKNIDFESEEFKVNSTIIKTIRWQNYYAYTCSITRDKSIGKLCIDPFIDEEPCSEKFEIILKNLTSKRSFLL